MAIYTPTLTTSARNKLGGVVFHGTNGTNIIRSRAIPVATKTKGQALQQNIIATAPQAWVNIYASQTFGWQALASWITYGSGTDFGVYVNPNNMWTGAWSNGQLLSAAPTLPSNLEPSAPPPITSLTLFLEFGTEAVMSAFDADGAYALPWLLYLTQALPPTGLVPANTGGTFIGGSLNGDPFDVGGAIAVATGRLVNPGDTFAVRAVSLYDQCWITGTSYAFNVTATE